MFLTERQNFERLARESGHTGQWPRGHDTPRFDFQHFFPLASVLTTKSYLFSCPLALLSFRNEYCVLINHINFFCPPPCSPSLAAD